MSDYAETPGGEKKGFNCSSEYILITENQWKLLKLLKLSFNMLHEEHMVLAN